MKWEYSKVDNETLLKKATEFNKNLFLTTLLLNRGMDKKLKVDDFLNINFSKLHNPMEFEKMDEVVEKIIKLKKEKSKIFIYGDYDVDGITAAAFLVIVFRNIGIEVNYYIPNRMEEGYGLNKKAINEIATREGKLIITVDTGINSLEEIRYAKSLGIDIVITDHHKLVEEDDKTIVTINPKLSKNYKFKFLSGAGVALKLAEAVYTALDEDLNEIYEYIDIIMIGTVADVVPMIDENRVIIKNGLKKIRNTNIKGLVYLLKYLRFNKKEITTTDISFFISPLLNALGRVGNSRIGVEFFLEEDEFNIYDIIEEMKKLNKKRRALEKVIFNEIDKKYNNIKNIKYIFEISEKWHPGVIGVVSSRLSIKYNVPVFIVSTRNGVGKASCRSISGINIFNVLSQISHKFNRFGGHDLAAGFVANINDLEEIKELVGEYILKNGDKKQKKQINIDSELKLEDINDEILRDLQELSPYGLGNPEPLFLDKDVVFINTKKFGVDNRHFKTFIKKNKKLYSAVGFNLGHKIDEQNCIIQKFDIVYYPEKVFYKGEEILQIKIKDFKIKDEFYNIFK
ncbi:single-stranded-DNA-specific exonuclease [Hypnocyclicus thermotrophus]|uniref:Single-stranded-DNA-specific exonuclease RecJ n=1 Tax=Hypnocyclicus thermotrophus TaxID=1627895 RepID=A0AA46DYP6_9FUSO|nr:single-stranded-DNA-specific exonuclease RecJ [Hypnocyclicus thermotrophus]TDT70482.1 single-stranded-DNA-specific exonuclease [Hypnocyclicus thermotrophus]